MEMAMIEIRNCYISLSSIDDSALKGQQPPSIKGN